MSISKCGCIVKRNTLKEPIPVCKEMPDYNKTQTSRFFQRKISVN